MYTEWYYRTNIFEITLFLGFLCIPFFCSNFFKPLFFNFIFNFKNSSLFNFMIFFLLLKKFLKLISRKKFLFVYVKSISRKKFKWRNNFFCLPIGTLEPVAKWHSCRLRVRIGRCPNISTLGGISLFPVPPPDFPTYFPAEEEDFPESPMSMSRMNHFRGLVSTIGEDGVDWIAVNRSTREPNP